MATLSVRVASRREGIAKVFGLLKLTKEEGFQAMLCQMTRALAAIATGKGGYAIAESPSITLVT
ncbi:hypothetical protein [uncultured Nostoc sp.]|uniref:hypothetical protein n=1 Tax=uncultured Nostoc sp. TaxID=340711 RepID=UPI0035CAF969